MLAERGTAGWRQALESHVPKLEDDAFDPAGLLAGSSFLLPLDAVDGGSSSAPGSTVFWGSGDWRDLSGSDGGVAWDGEVSSGHLGVDYRLNRNSLAGLSVSLSRGTLDYRDGSGAAEQTGTYKTTLTSIHPYVAGLSLGSGVRMWAMGGIGTGDVEITDGQKGTQSGDLKQTSVAAGVGGTVLSSDDLIEGGRTTVELRAEGSFARAEIDGSGPLASVDSDVHRVRLSLDAGHARVMSAHATLTPSVEIGFRSDGGDGATGTGLEVGGALSYRNSASGLTMEVRTRALAGHSGDTEEWGVGGMVRKEPGTGGQGLSLSLAPTLGILEGRSERVWDAGVAGRDDLADTEARLVSEMGYGLSVMSGRGLLTPYAGFTVSEGGSLMYRAGGRLAVGSSTSLGLEGTHREWSDDQDADNELMLRASMVW